MKIIVIAPDFPYPAIHGGRVDVLRRLEIFKKMGVKVDLLVTVKDQPSSEEIQQVQTLVNNLIIVKRDMSFANLFSFLPYQIVSRKGIAEAQLSDTYDWVFIEGDYVASILKNKSLKAKKVFIRVNNNESRYFAKLAQSVFPKPSTLYYLLDSIKFSFFSNRLYKQADLLGFVSSEELQKFEKQNHGLSNKRIQLLCHYDIEKFRKIRIDNNGNVLFVGSLFMPNNVDGLNWYLKKVHPHLTSVKGYKLTIVGSTGGDKKLQSTLKEQFEKYTKVEINFDVRDLEPFYEDATIFINPMFKGAGIKVKTLQAIQYALPVVSTSVGAEGLNLKDSVNVFVSDDPIFFSKRVEELMGNSKIRSSIVHAAQKHLIDIDATSLLSKYLYEEL